jgi:GT2 family glycosyltransferase/ubiquinone/menaquinone biosynthesis C-methylase UbiE
MDFTGERYVPSIQGQIQYEHLHRYALSLNFVEDKAVLDIASGEGYGAALLASKAQSVTGVDIDPQTVMHAKHTYCNPKLTFMVGSCDAVPLPDSSFDVVTSFETIEHHDKHEEMLDEIKRVLKPDGVLIISSPNRLTYSDEPGYTNPFHVKELYYDEFKDLLQRRFQHVRLYGQRLAAASFVSPLQDSTAATVEAWSGDNREIVHKMRPLPSPIYFVAICSNRSIPEHGIGSFYFDPANDLLETLQKDKAQAVHRMEEQLRLTEHESAQAIRRMEEAMADARWAYEKQIRSDRDELIVARSRYRIELRRWEKETVALIAARDKLEERLRTYQAWLEEAKAQLSRHADMLDWMYTECAWRAHPIAKDLERWNDRRNRFRNKIRPQSSTPPFHGVLDYPKSDVPAGDSIEVYGWVYSTADRITRIQAFLDSRYLGIVPYGVERPDVAAAFPADAPVKCGYQELFWLDRQSISGEALLRVIVYDGKGNKQTFTRTITVAAPTEAPAGPAANDSGATVPASPATPDVAPLVRHSSVHEGMPQMEAAIADFQERSGNNPSILDWNSRAQVENHFPKLAVCSRKDPESTLPYFDGTFDFVVISAAESDRVSEAKRVAAAAVICVGSNSKDGDGRLEVDWNESSAAPQAFPTASIIIPAYNQAGYTQSCLARVTETLPHRFRGEIIVVDDASSDETQNLLARWAATDNRIKVLRNSENAGFIASCNRGANTATGEILVFLNNDTLPAPGWLPPLLRTFRQRPDAGAVGGKLLYPDGALQEAGGIIFSDGVGCNFGKRDRAADAPLYSFVREVDYCSGALLATPRELFIRLGGFDARFAPAYYEDADYCFTLRAHGYRVYYQPESAIVHFEGASCGVDISAGVKSYQEVNRTKFVEKWSAALRNQPAPPERFDYITLHALAVRNSTR